MSGARTVCPSRRGVVTAKQRNRTWRKKYGLKVDLVAMRRFPDLQLALTTHQVDAAVCPEFDAMHKRYCGDLLNGVCAPRRGRMLACQVRRSATWVTRPWAFRGRFISRAMWWHSINGRRSGEKRV